MNLLKLLLSVAPLQGRLWPSKLESLMRNCRENTFSLREAALHAAPPGQKIRCVEMWCSSMWSQPAATLPLASLPKVHKPAAGAAHGTNDVRESDLPANANRVHFRAHVSAGSTAVEGGQHSENRQADVKGSEGGQVGAGSRRLF